MNDQTTVTTGVTTAIAQAFARCSHLPQDELLVEITTTTKHGAETVLYPNPAEAAEAAVRAAAELLEYRPECCWRNADDVETWGVSFSVVQLRQGPLHEGVLWGDYGPF